MVIASVLSIALCFLTSINFKMKSWKMGVFLTLGSVVLAVLWFQVYLSVAHP